MIDALSKMNWHNRIMRACQENADLCPIKCPHWFSTDHCMELRKQDEIDEGSRAQEYYDNSHMLTLILRPAFRIDKKNMIIVCKPMKLSYCPPCEWQNTDIEEIIKKEYLASIFMET